MLGENKILYYTFLLFPWILYNNFLKKIIMGFIFSKKEKIEFVLSENDKDCIKNNGNCIKIRTGSE